MVAWERMQATETARSEVDERRCLQLLRCLGLVLGFLCMLAGCGGNSGVEYAVVPCRAAGPVARAQVPPRPKTLPAASASRRQGWRRPRCGKSSLASPGLSSGSDSVASQGGDLLLPQVLRSTPRNRIR
jgi:hypothetical protein